MPILTGVDGERKMSKSLGNAINLEDPSGLMFAKIQGLPDETVLEWLDLLASKGALEWFHQMMRGTQTPRDCQKFLAFFIVSEFHGVHAAIEEWGATNRAPQETPELADIPEAWMFPVNLAWAISQLGAAPSSSEAKRSIRSGVVQLGDRVITDDRFRASRQDLSGQTLRIGKRKIIKFKE